MYQRFILLGGLCLFLYTGIGLLLWQVQRDLIYFPTPATEVEHFSLWEPPTDGAPNQVWTHHRGRSKAIIYFGGNAESMAPAGALLRTLFPEHAIYLPLYPGYGGSPGEPDEQALYAEALNLYDSIADRHRQISVIGRSLGSAVATYLAAERDLEKLVLVTPFDSMESLAQETISIYPMELMLRDKYDSASRARDIDEPVLMIVASGDEIVSRSHSDRLRVAFDASQVDEVIVDKSTHNSVSTKREYAMALLLFLDEQAPQVR